MGVEVEMLEVERGWARRRRENDGDLICHGIRQKGRRKV